MRIREILDELRMGKRRATRTNWNGKNMWIYMESGKIIPHEELSEPQKSWFSGNMKILPHLNMRAADGSIVVGWIASQTDLLADDWELLEETPITKLASGGIVSKDTLMRLGM